MPSLLNDLHGETRVIERRALRWLLLFWCCFIFYGSFIPFRFSADPTFVESQLIHFFTPLFVNGVRQFSIPDVVSNVLLFIPFGFLWVGSEIGKRIFSRMLGTAVMIGVLGLLFGLTIETGQLFSPGRTASVLDALCNSLGAGIGGALGYIIFRALRGYRASALKAIIREKPSLVILLLLMLAVLVDAYYPFEITLDVSTAWHNLRDIHWVPFIAGPHRLWSDLVVEKVFLYAAIGYLVVNNLPPQGSAPLALWLSIAFAVSVEGGKLFFVGRVPNLENVVLGGFGAAVGTSIIASLGGTAFVRRHCVSLLLVLVVGVIIYSELSPFDWISIAELSGRVSKIEWLPFSSYYGADPQSALFDLAKKLFLVGPMGFLIAFRNRGGKWASLSVGLLCGVVLEAWQIALSSRIPSVTDVLIFGIASWIGAVVYDRLSLLERGSKHDVEAAARPVA